MIIVIVILILIMIVHFFLDLLRRQVMNRACTPRRMRDHVFDKDGGGESSVDDVLIRAVVLGVVAPIRCEFEDVDGTLRISGDFLAKEGFCLTTELRIGRSCLREDVGERHGF